MPAHFLVSVSEGEESLLVDPFAGGRIMTRESCRVLLAGFNHSFREGYLKPVSDHHMIRRMIANLIRSWHDRHAGAHLARLYRFINVLQEKRDAKAGEHGRNVT